jgi:hypothetical protein
MGFRSGLALDSANLALIFIWMTLRSTLGLRSAIGH